MLKTATTATPTSTSAAMFGIDVVAISAVVVGLGIALTLFGNPYLFAIGAGLIVTVLGLAASAACVRLLG